MTYKEIFDFFLLDYKLKCFTNGKDGPSTKKVQFHVHLCKKLQNFHEYDSRLHLFELFTKCKRYLKGESNVLEGV